MYIFRRVGLSTKTKLFLCFQNKLKLKVKKFQEYSVCSSWVIFWKLTRAANSHLLPPNQNRVKSNCQKVLVLELENWQSSFKNKFVVVESAPLGFIGLNFNYESNQYVNLSVFINFTHRKRSFIIIKPFKIPDIITLLFGARLSINNFKYKISLSTVLDDSSIELFVPIFEIMFWRHFLNKENLSLRCCCSWEYRKF